jgi:hypothetical protein
MLFMDCRVVTLLAKTNACHRKRSPVIASEAKQSIARLMLFMDCRVVTLLAKTNASHRKRSPATVRKPVIASEAKQSTAPTTFAPPVIASEAKQSILRLMPLWIAASLHSSQRQNTCHCERSEAIHCPPYAFYGLPRRYTPRKDKRTKKKRLRFPEPLLIVQKPKNRILRRGLFYFHYRCCQPEQIPLFRLCGILFCRSL